MADCLQLNHRLSTCCLENAADKLASVHGIKVRSRFRHLWKALEFVRSGSHLHDVCCKATQWNSMLSDALNLLFALQPGNIVINPSVVRNKAGNAVTPRKFLVCAGPRCCRMQS